MDGPQRVEGPGRADLAERVAEEDLARALGVAADAPAQPLGGRHEALADLGHELGPLGVLGARARVATPRGVLMP